MSDVDIIAKILGPFGKWQLRSALLIFLVKIPSSWFMACLIFTAKTSPPGEIFCRPRLNNTLIDAKFWIFAAHPYKYDFIEQEDSFDYCKVYNNAQSRYRNETAELGHDFQKCTKFKQTPSFQSLIHQFELFCGRDFLVPLTQSFHLLGILIGGLIAAYLLKKKSPREIMLIGMILQILLGLATGLAPTYELHIIFRCSVAAACSLMCTGIMILMDITSGKYRVICVCFFEFFWSIGVLLLPFVAHPWKSWRMVYAAISLPTISLFFVYPWIPDSPRWLLKHGRKEVLNILLDAACINNKNLDKNLIQNELNNLSQQYRNEPEEPSIRSIWKGSFRHKINLLIAHAGWSVYLSLYFASLIHVRALGRNYLEVNTMVGGISEIFGILIALFLILKTSKKWAWASLLNILTSVIGLSANFVPHSFSPHDRMIIYLITSMTAKATVSTTLVLFIACMSELVTKEKRNACTFSGVTVARTIVMAAPFIGYCSSFGSALISQNIMMGLNIGMSVLIGLFIRTQKTLEKDVKNCKNNEEIIALRNDKL